MTSSTEHFLVGDIKSRIDSKAGTSAATTNDTPIYCNRELMQELRVQVEQYQADPQKFANIDRYVGNIPLLENKMTGTTRHFTRSNETRLGRALEGVDPTEPPYFTVEPFDFDNNARLRATFALDEDDPEAAESFPYTSSLSNTATAKKRATQDDPHSSRQSKAPRFIT